MLLFSITPATLFHSVLSQNFQRPGLLRLGVNEIGLMLQGEHMPKLFSGLELVFLRGYAAGRRGGGQGVEVVLFQTLTRIKS